MSMLPMAEPHVLTGLATKRAELAGQIEHTQDKLDTANVRLLQDDDEACQVLPAEPAEAGRRRTSAGAGIIHAVGVRTAGYGPGGLATGFTCTCPF